MSECQTHHDVAAGPGVHPGVFSGEGWYAVYTRSNFEKRVAAGLSRKGIYAYVPTTSEMHRWKDRSKQVEPPLFPGYVFVRLVPSDETLIQVLRTSGAVKILGGQGQPEKIPDAEIEALRVLLTARVHVSTHPLLKEGATVRVKRGPLAGVEGLLMRIKSETRLVLSVGLLSRSVATEIDNDDVELTTSGYPS